MVFYLADTSFLSPSFIGSNITFPENAGTWTLTEKQAVTHSLYTKQDSKRGGISAAFGTFACRNVKYSNQTAIVRVLTQIPHVESLGYKQSEKAQQASKKFDSFTNSEYNSYNTLSKAGCKSIRPVLGCRIETQSNDDPVPGGFRVFLLLGHVPGIQLGSVFWTHPFPERQQIRQAFRAAWEECMKYDVCPLDMSLASLTWNKYQGKIYITGMQYCEQAEGHYWKDTFWFAWNLAVAPRDFDFSDEKRVHPDTSNWEM